MPRAFVLILDSVGIGASADASQYGDTGADTVGHLAECCARRQADRTGVRSGTLFIPNLVRLGLGEACRLATGRVPPGLETPRPVGRYGCASEISRGKDTPSGHWELAGVPVRFDWGYFPREVPAFPPNLVETLCREGHLPGILGNRHASGTEVIKQLGDEHVRTLKPICYTSADSVFQIAAHEETFGLERLYDLCLLARRLVDPLKIGRVIARPFIGTGSNTFARTGNRRDYSVPPPGPTLLDHASAAARDVVSIGKIADIFAHSGTGRVLKASGNAAVAKCVLEAVRELADGGLLFANFIDFDMIYGHRRDPAGYAAALEGFDAWLPKLADELRLGDLVIITADHGCDPTWHGTEHTREQVPILAFGPSLPAAPIGHRATFADVAAAVAKHLDITAPTTGTPF
jgi:phosphopentomutase